MDLIGNDISIDDITSVPDDSEYALSSILAEYGGADETCPAPAEAEAAEPARPIILGEDAGVLTAELSSGDEFSPEPRAAVVPLVSAPEAEPAPEPEPQSADEDDDMRIYHIGDILAETAAQPAAGYEPEYGASVNDTGDETADRAVPPFEERPASDAEETAGGEPVRTPPGQAHRGRSFAGGLAAPFISLLALIALKKQQMTNAGSAAAEEEEDLGPELDAESASRYYTGNVKSLRLRLRLSILLSVILVWISFGLPVAGLLKTSPAALALVCLILDLTVVMLGWIFLPPGSCPSSE
jgi:hypothetical protein